ncbi:MAG: penicillin-binding protein activator LpoB [Planctomycetes bacterium]|nr:penicillin-binding protein activator LpoB [Planctomycetota bacterium]
MDRRRFLSGFGKLALGGWVAQTLGCARGKQYAHVLNDSDKDMVGSHTAGAETWEPLIDQSVAKLLGRQMTDVKMVSHDGSPCKKRVCFVGLENKSIEELGDFGEQIYEKIDTAINESEVFEVINRRFVQSGLRKCQLRPDDLYDPASLRMFTAAMEKDQQPFDYLLYAKITSGTTKSNKRDYQRDYLLTMELVDVVTGHADKDSQQLRKGYHKSVIGKLKNYG